MTFFTRVLKRSVDATEPLLAHLVHAAPLPCAPVVTSHLSFSSLGHSSKPMSGAIRFCRRRSTSDRRLSRVLIRCRRSVLELHHDALVPTSLTTGATHRSSGLASVSPSAEPPPPLRALSDVPQTSPPPHRIALPSVPDPPHRRQTPESGWPPPPFHGPRPTLCQ
jgi:hypothetical protein